jgi:hypothetical protein
MSIKNTLLIGSGLSRSTTKEEIKSRYTQSTWSEVLNDLINFANVEIRNADEKPLSFLMDEVLLKSKLPENEIFAKLAYYVGSCHHIELTKLFSSLSDNILTTNYQWPTHLLPGFKLPLVKKYPDIAETNYSLFRAYTANNKNIWHINGDNDQPTSIALGSARKFKNHSHIVDYLNNGVKSGKLKIAQSPLFRGIPELEFDSKELPYSWVDLFLRDQIQIIGLGMDLSEYTLWYLLTVKAYLQQRYPKYIGGVTYHQVNVKGKCENNKNKLNMLEDLGGQINLISAPSYFDGYMTIADQISPKVSKTKK